MPFLLLRISRFAAAGLLLLGLVLPWFRVPVSVFENLNGGYSAICREPVSTTVFKVFILGVLLSAWLIGFRRRRSGSHSSGTAMAVGACLVLVVLSIAYPALTIQRCAAVSAHAEWLRTQHSSLIGEAATAQEYDYQPGEPLVDVADVIPASFSALPVPDLTSFSDVHLSKLDKVLMWLGLAPGFCQFAALGWFCAIFGSFLLAVSFLRMKESEGVNRGDLKSVYTIVPFFVFGTFLLATVLIAPVVMAGRELAEARTAVANGSFSESLHHLDLAEAYVPILAYNTDDVYQRGWLDRKLGLNSSAAQLVSAIREEEEGFYSRAAQHYSELLDPDRPGPVRDEAFRGALRLAIKDLNAGLLERAASRLAQLTSIDPSSIKANYALQLADLRSSRKDRLESEVAKFEAVYKCFASIEKSALLASAHRRMAELDYDFQDTEKLGDEMRAAIKP
jgi:hypothetical protein